MKVMKMPWGMDAYLKTHLGAQTVTKPENLGIQCLNKVIDSYEK